MIELKDLNLLPKVYLNQKDKKKYRIYYIAAIEIGAVALVLAIILPLITLYSLNLEKSGLEQKIIVSNNFYEVDSQYRSLKSIYEKRETAANNLSKSERDITSLIDRINKKIPEKVFFTNMNLSVDANGTITIQLTGIAANQDDIASCIYNLKKDPQITKVTIGGISSSGIEIKNPQYNFALSVISKK